MIIALILVYLVREASQVKSYDSTGIGAIRLDLPMMFACVGIVLAWLKVPRVVMGRSGSVNAQ